ncbi:transcription factor TFIIIB component B'' homolog isoform X2 [Microcaecilia unicolor]|uniref:Transcription factor TFIIIB component B'' homolog isoform X2 n=1 Tax=Microcaecilia unicolor TaxID=1415580 RepID=A0A6P7X787_9AMPH|nr:transcription factor TFIIIB component B'' homolog isoform X2 [Microcaecilia unicolor]
MLRRARLSVRPNVKPGGRAAAVAPAPSQPEDGSTSGAPTDSVSSTGELPTPNCDAESRESSGEVVVGTTPPVAAEGREEKPFNDAGGSTKPSVTALQRRKRIVTTLNLAKPRSSLPSVQRAHTAALSSSREQTPEHLPNSSAPIQNVLPQPEKSSPEASPKSAAKTVSFLGQGHVLPEKKTPVPQVPHFSPFKKSARKELNVRTNAERGDEVPQKDTLSPLKERPSQRSSGPGEITVCSRATPPKKIQRGSDKERILKAQKLRELLREELKKERKVWRENHPVFEISTPVDRSKMIMRDFIYYLPEINPMKSSFTEEKKVEKSSPASFPGKELQIKSTPPEPEFEDEEVEEETVEEDGEGSLLVPRVKVAEDGSIILDEESLTVEVLRTKGPAVVEENDPIFERGSTTTYSSFRKSCYSKPWSNRETDMFFLAISMVGTDFSMIGQLFPHRARTEIKNKFKREERSNGWRIDKAFKEKQPFDSEFFANLLEKALIKENKKKQKAAKITNSGIKKPAKTRTKQKAKTSLDEVGFSSNDRGTSDTEAVEVDAGSAEKENEESLSVHEGQAAAEPGRAKKKRRKKKKNEDPSLSVAEQPSEGNEVSAKLTGTERARNKKETLAVEDTGDGDSPTDSCGVPECLEEQESLPVTLLIPEESHYHLPGSEEIEDGSEQHNSTSKQDSLSEHNESAVSDASKSSRSQTLHPSKSKIKVSAARDKGEAGVDTDEAKTQNAEVCDQISPTEDSTAAEKSQEAHGPVKADRGWVHRPKPNLAQASGKKELPSHSESTEVDDKNVEQLDALNITMKEAAEEKDEDVATDLKTNKTAMSSETKQSAIRPAQLPRGRSQRPKPNLGRAAGRKEVASIERATEEKSMEKGSQQNEEHSMLPSLNCTSDQTEEAQQTCISSREHAVPYFGKADFSQIDNVAVVNVASEFQTEQNSSLEDSAQRKVTEEPSRSGEKPSPPEKSKHDVVKSVQLTRSRFRPKPNLDRASGRKETSVTEKDTAERWTTAEQANQNVIEHAEGSSSLSSSDNNLTSPAQEQSLHLLDDSSSTYLTQKSKGTKTLQSSQKSPGKPESEEMADGENVLELTAKEHIKSDEEPDISCLVKGDALKSDHVRRGRFQRPKPNLSRTSGRKEASGTEVATEEEKGEVKKSGTLLADGSGCRSLLRSDVNHTSLDQEQSTHLLDDSNSKEDKASKRPQSPEKSSGSMGKRESEENADVEKVLELAAKEHIRSDEEPDIPCQNKGDALKPGQLRRGRSQRPKPNLGRAAGRKETPLAKEVAIEEKHETEKNGTLLGDSSGCSSLPTSYVNLACLAKEQSPCLLDDSKCTDLIEKGKGSKRLQSLEKSPGSTGKPESEEMTDEENALQLAGKEHLRSDEEPDSTCQSKGDALKPGQLRTDWFQRLKPNLGRASGRKETPVAEVTTVEEKPEAEKSGTLLNDGNNCSSLPTSHALQHEGDVPFLSSMSPEKYELTDSEQAGLPCTSLWSENIQPPARLIESKDEIEQRVESQMDHTVGKTMEVSPSEEPSPQAVSKLSALKPAPLRRGRFQKPKPNLVRAAERKGTAVGEKGAIEETTEAGTTVKHVDDGCRSDRTVDDAAKCEEVLASPSAKTVDSEQVTLTPSTPKPFSYATVEDREFAEDSLSADAQEKNVEAVRTDVKLVTQEESTADVLEPRKLMRGRFLKPKPNLGRAAGRKEPTAKKKDETESSFSSAPDNIGSDNFLSAAHIAANEALLGETSKQSPSECEDLTTSEQGGASQVNRVPQSQSETAEKFSHKSSFQEEFKQSVIKPAQPAKSKLQRPKSKPNLGTADSQTETPEQGKHIFVHNTEAQLLEEDPIQPIPSSRELPLLPHSSCTEEMPLSSHMGKRKDPDDSVEVESLKRRRLLNKSQPPASTENKTSTEEEEDVLSSSALPPVPVKTARLGRQCKKPEPMKAVPASAAKSEANCCKKSKTPQKPKPHAPKGKGSKRRHLQHSGKGHKTTLVTLRALQEEDEDDDGDSEQDYEEENYHLPPEEVNKAPVFVPRSLRSPNPVPAEIEETVEEFEIADIIDADCIPDTKSSPGVQEEFVLTGRNHNTSVAVAPCMASYQVPEEEAEIDGSTEAAMTLLAMRDPMFQSRMNIQGTTFVFNNHSELKDETPAVLNQCNVEPNVTPVIQPFSPSIISEPSPSEQEGQGPSAEQSTGVIMDIIEVKSNVHAPSELSVSSIKNTLSVTSGSFLKSRPIIDRASEKPKSETNHNAPQVPSDMEEKAPLGSTVVHDPDKIDWSSLHLHESGSSDTCTGHIVKNDRLEEPNQEIQETKTESCTLAGSPRPQTYEAESDSMPYHNSEELHPEESTHLFTDSSCTFTLEQVMSEEQNSEMIQYQNLITDLDQTTVDLVANDYLKEEETIILTLVEIPVSSIDGYHDSGAALPLGSEHMLVAPVIISPVCTGLTEGQSTGSMMTAIDNPTTTSDNQPSTSEYEIATSVMSVSELRPISRKRVACEPEENDIPHAKKKQPYFIKDGSKDTPLELTISESHENKHSVESQFPKEETAAVSEGTCAIIVQEEPLAPLQNSDTSQLSVTSADGDEALSNDQATGASARKHCKGKKMEAEQNLKNTRLKQSRETCVSTASSSRVSLTKPGRRPRGFLSLICKNSGSENEKDTKSNSSRTQKSHISSPKPCLKSRASSIKDKVPCTLTPEGILSAVGDSRVCKDTSGPPAKVPHGEHQEEAVSHSPDSETEEPTRVSEYFFSDIFMEVDEKD